jgi:hypothetical protein
MTAQLVDAIDRLTEAIKANPPMNIVINTTSTDPEALAKRIHEGIQNANEHRN